MTLRTFLTPLLVGFGFSLLCVNARADLSGEVLSVLRDIEQEANGLVPPTALRYWVEMQKGGPRSYTEGHPIDAVTRGTLETVASRPQCSSAIRERIRNLLRTNRASASEIRSVVVEFLGQVEEKIGETEDLSRLRYDFKDQAKILERLYQNTNPPWYTFEAFTTSEFLGLTAIPLNIYGISDEISHADAHVLTPKQFLFHDELHSVAMISTQDEEMAARKIVPGTVEYYRAVLDRIRFTRSFVKWSEQFADPVERQIIRTLWFDAFHDFFKTLAPFRNYYPTEANLREYIGRRVTSDTLINLYERIRLRRGLDHKNRFTPGDFLAYDATNASEFTPERIMDAYRKLGTFAHFDESRDGDRFWREVKRKFANLGYMCRAWFQPYEKIF